MRKLCLLLIIVMVAVNMAACSPETVTLRCDGENCKNIVEVKVTKDARPDESWVVFCQDCADNVLDD